MRNSIKSRKAGNIGKGNVTPVQIAFIVDRYLLDNDFTQTRSTFRSEASKLISKSPVQEAPKSLLSLGAMLDEYIHLKEQKVSMDQERYRMEQDKFRVNNLLKGLQDAMNAFNSTAHLVNPLPQQPHVINDLPIGSPPGYYSAYRSPAVIPKFKQSNSVGDTTGVSTQTTNHTAFKRKPSKDSLDFSLAAKRSCKGSTTANHLLPKDSMAHSQPSMADNHQVISQEHSLVRSDVYGGPMVNGSNSVQSSHVVKCLFTKPVQSPPTNSSDPKTPPLPYSSQAEKPASPIEMSSTVTSGKDITPQEITSTDCSIIASETIQVSPAKQISYYSIARNQYISTSSPVKVNLRKPNKRDHVKGRLDFDVLNMHTSSEQPVSNEISTSEYAKEVDILDLDLQTLDALGNINISELLVDFDLADEGTSYSSQPSLDSSPDSIRWSPQKSLKSNLGANQVISHLSSTVTEIRSEKDTTSSSGPDSFTTVKSVTKTIKILSPAKSQRGGLGHKVLPAQDKLD